jgi:hypothetical protein
MDHHAQIKELMMEVLEVDIHHAYIYHYLYFELHNPLIVHFDRMKQVVVVVVEGYLV